LVKVATDPVSIEGSPAAAAAKTSNKYCSWGEARSEPNQPKGRGLSTVVGCRKPPTGRAAELEIVQRVKYVYICVMKSINVDYAGPNSLVGPPMGVLDIMQALPDADLAPP
jgi:hypothetical protein